MIENKLFSILNTVSSVEKNAIEKWLLSPAHNQREDLILFWKALQLKKFQKLNHSARYALMFPNEPFDDFRWRQLQSMMVAQIEDFFAWKRLKEDKLKTDLIVSAEYRKRNLASAQDHVITRATERFTTIPQNIQYHEIQYQLAWEQYTSGEHQKRSGSGRLADVINSFDQYAIAVKLRLACLSASHQAVFQAQYDTTLTELMLEYLQSHKCLQVPTIALYYHCYYSLTTGEESHFRAFREQLEKMAGQLPMEEHRALLLMAINFCIRGLNHGEVRYAREAFDLYKLGIDNGGLIENGVLSRFAYKNVVTLGIRLEDFDWVEDFITQRSHLLDPQYRDAIRNYNLAGLYCARNEFDKAMPLLAQVDETDLLLNLDSRIMLMKMYYETEGWDALDALLSSFRILLLRKKKIIGYHQQNYLNTVRWVKKIVSIPLNDRAIREKLRAELLQAKHIIEKEWLLQKLDRRR